MTANISRIVAIVVCALSASASAADDQFYLSLVGELAGKAESLRMLRDFCAEAVPERSSKNAQAYDAWTKRNSTLLAAVEVQRRNADARIAKQAAENPGQPKSTQEMIALLQSRLGSQFKQSNLESKKKVCDGYPAFIASSERERADEIQSLVDAVARAHEALIRSESQR